MISKEELMDKITYKEKYYVKSSEVDIHQKIKLSSLLKIFQDLATEGSKILDAGTDKTLDKGYLWVFSKLEININRFPVYEETINLSTYPNEMMHFIYPRTFLIKDLNDNLLVEATSFWCLINAQTRKIALPSETGVGVDAPLKAKKIDNIESKDVNLVSSRKVLYTDLDLNQHLNNTRYLDFICDLYDSNYFNINHIKKINLSFVQEVKEKEVVDIYASTDNTYFLFKVNNIKVFECNIEYNN
ncbi:MAG: hypothetical protein J5691_03170 [Bacilli bacterium]|nr:hypothetical protein [Bacilli bacterium]